MFKYRRALLLVAAVVLGTLATQAGAQCSYSDYVADQERVAGNNTVAMSGTGLCGHASAWTLGLENAECDPVRMLGAVAAAATSTTEAARIQIEAMTAPQ